jgi:hypothetical protein
VDARDKRGHDEGKAMDAQVKPANDESVTPPKL